MKSRMPKMRASLLIALLALVLGGCGGNQVDDAGTDPYQEQQLSLSIVYAGGDAAHKQGIAKIVSDFELSHPNIRVTEMNSGSSTYLEYLKTKDAVGEFPDLMEMRDTQMFADAGLISSLPDDMAALFKNVPAVNGKVYNAPLDLPQPQGIIYNKKVFREAGITREPRTLQEFMDICDIIKAKGISPLVLGGKDIWHMAFWTNKFLMDEVYAPNPNWNAQRTKKEVSWTDEGPKKAMNELMALWKNGYVQPGFTAIADGQTASYLIEGEAAMLYSGPWMFRQILQLDPNFELGFFALPGSNGIVTVAGLPIPSGWSISSEAANDPDKVKVVRQFLYFFYNKDEYLKYLEAVNGIPAIDGDIEYETIEPMKKALEIMKDPGTRQSMYMSSFWGDNQIPAGFRNWFYRLVQDMAAGKYTVDEAMRMSDAEWDRTAGQ